MDEPVIRARGIYKSFDGLPVVEDFTIELRRGAVAGIVGPNGAGKTTILRILAGLLEPDRGLVERRGRVGYVPQDDMLLPWLTIRGNIELGLKARHVPVEERRRRVAEAAELLGLTDYLDMYPGRVSGGTRRKAAIARALVLQPDALLLDEPYTGLDRRSVEALQGFIRRIRREGIAVLLVSHQLAELVEVADTVYVVTERPARIRGVLDLTRPGARERIMELLTPLLTGEA